MIRLIYKGYYRRLTESGRMGYASFENEVPLGN